MSLVELRFFPVCFCEQCSVITFTSSACPLCLHCKKRFTVFPSAAGMSLTELFLAGNYLFPASSVSDLPAADGKTANLFLQCMLYFTISYNKVGKSQRYVRMYNDFNICIEGYAYIILNMSTKHLTHKNNLLQFYIKERLSQSYSCPSHSVLHPLQQVSYMYEP